MQQSGRTYNEPSVAKAIVVFQNQYVVALFEGKLVLSPAFEIMERYEILGLVGAHCCGMDEAVFGGAGRW